MIDFTTCRILKKTYGGANGKKKCIEYNNELYMVKFPVTPSHINEQSYTNGCISEYLGCHIFDLLGVPVQQTLLGTYEVNNNNKIVVACKDLEQLGYSLKDFASLKNSVLNTGSGGSGTELADVMDTIEQQQIVDVLELKQRFWDMFVVDSLLGNFDRHNGNWGYLYNLQTDKCKLAPVFDCGSCLYPQADENMVKRVLESEEELKNRIYVFPTSALKINGKKINYFDFWKDVDNKDCINSLHRIVEKINIEAINELIDSIECIDDNQKAFYKLMIQSRKELILDPVAQRTLNVFFINAKEKAMQGVAEQHTVQSELDTDWQL